MMVILDEGLDEFGATTHAGTTSRLIVDFGTAWIFAQILPWRQCLAWLAVVMALEVSGWFATRRQFLRKSIGWRTRLWHAATLLTSSAAWVVLGAWGWMSGTLEGAICGPLLWMSLIFFAQTNAYQSRTGFVMCGGAPAVAALAIVLLAPHARGLNLTPVVGILALSLVFAAEGVRRMLNARRHFDAAQGELRESERLYRVLADNVTDGISLADIHGKRIYMSPSIENALGYPLEELYRLPVYAYIYEEDREPLRRKTRELAEKGGSVTAEYRVVRGDGQVVWVETNFTLAGAERGIDPPQIISVARVIQARKELEAQLVEARRAAEAGAAAKSDFLANMTHELRTPLNAIIGFASLLKASPALQGQDARHASLVCDASATLLDLVNDVLDFSRLEAGAAELDPTPFDPAAEARGIMALISGQAEAKGLALRLETEGEGYLAGDTKRLRQVLLNFLSNAVKFTAQGGVTLRVAQGPADGGGARRLRIEVADTGVGLPADAIPHLFERFTQADVSVSRRYGGTGLGLAISKKIIDLMGGEIGAESVEGQGSTFWFDVTLPVAEAPGAVAETTAAELERNVRLLLVEDVAVNRELVKTVLAPFDVDVDEAEDGVAAVEAFRRSHYDLVLMDVQMPVMDGLTATRRIRALPLPGAATTPIVAMTANVLPEQVARCLAAGMDGHLGKPMNPGALLNAIAYWTEHGRAPAEAERAAG